MKNIIPLVSKESVLDEVVNIKHTTHKYRFLKKTDISYFNKWINDEEVIRYSLTKFHKIKSKEEIENWFSTMLVDDNCFSVGMENLDGELIGHVGIAGINTVDKNGEYFIFIGNKKSWGKGIASQATKDIVDLGFKVLGLHRILLTASSANKGALKAYRKAGFRDEGIMREAFYRNNEFSNKVFMGILRSEWEQS